MRKVEGVNLDRINWERINISLRRNQLAIGGTDQQRLRRLVAFYREHTPKQRLADCSTCGGVSDIIETCCPFCGDTDVGEKTDMLAVVVDQSPIIMTPERQLDAAVKRVHEWKARTADSLWELGNEIQQLYDTGLWQKRTNPDGTPKYRQWAMFVEQELSISNTYSYRLMDICSQFTREQVRDIGPTKLSMTLKVTSSDRIKMLRAAADGATVSQLRDLAREIGSVASRSERKRKSDRHYRRGKGRKAEKFRIKEVVTRRELVPHREGDDKGQRIRIPMPLICEEMITPTLKQRIVLTNEIDGTLILVIERMIV